MGPGEGGGGLAWREGEGGCHVDLVVDQLEVGSDDGVRGAEVPKRKRRGVEPARQVVWVRAARRARYSWVPRDGGPYPPISPTHAIYFRRESGGLMPRPYTPTDTS